MTIFKARKNIKSLIDSLKTKTEGEVYSEKVFRSIIERERARSDRTDQKFSLIVLDLEFVKGNHNINGHLMKKLFSRIRRIDEIGMFNPQRIGIILPYTCEKGAQKFAESLCKLMGTSMAQCVFNIYTYGSDRTITKELNKELIRKGA